MGPYSEFFWAVIKPLAWIDALVLEMEKSRTGKQLTTVWQERGRQKWLGMEKETPLRRLRERQWGYVPWERNIPSISREEEFIARERGALGTPKKEEFTRTSLFEEIGEKRALEEHTKALEKHAKALEKSTKVIDRNLTFPANVAARRNMGIE